MSGDLLFDVEEVDEVAPSLVPDVPQWRGSEAQIAWAEKIRTGKLLGINRWIRERQELAAKYTGPKNEALRLQVRLALDRLEQLEREDRAWYWIDRRSNTADELLIDAPAKPGPGLTLREFGKEKG